MPTCPRVAAVVMLPLLMALSSCAHRPPAASTRLVAPAPPPHAANGAPDHLKRAEDVLERLRKQLAPRSTAVTPTDPHGAGSAQPTDAPDEPASRRPLGTTWSVVVSQSPPVNKGSVTGSPSESASARTGDAPAPARHAFDLVGGAIAALCGTLAIRKRVRGARPT